MGVKKTESGEIIGAEKDAGIFNVHRIIGELRRNWIWFAGSVLVCLALAFLYLRYSTPVYKINATLLVKDDQKGADIGGANANVLQDLGLFAGKSNVDNEVEILKSRTLMESAVQDMQLNVRYFSEGRIKSKEVFTKMPFRVAFVPLYADSIRHDVHDFKFDVNPKGFSASGLGNSWQGKWGDTVNTSIGRMLVYLPAGNAKLPEAETYTIQVRSVDDVVAGYMRNLTAVVTNKQVSTINLTLQEELPRKGEAILNTLIETYMRNNVNDKNRIADSTIKFIDERLGLVGAELTGIEKQIQEFKTNNKLADITEQSKQLISNTGDYVKLLTQSEVQLNVVQSLNKYLAANGNSRSVIPSSLVVQNPALSGIVDAYNKLQMDRERLLMTNTEESPLVRNLDQQISNLRAEMNNSLASLQKELQVTVQEYRRHAGGLDNAIAQVPAKERIYLEYSRQQNIKQELYLFLLTKREETALTKSSTMSNIRIVDAAKSDSGPFKPKRPLIMASALLLGLMLPAGFLYLWNILNTKLGNKEDITTRTAAPILGEIGRNIENYAIVVNRKSRSHIAEQFRSLRTNIQFLLTHRDQKTILVTSSMSGEGKSFVAMNLASTFALLGKKVVLMELDLRKPKISQHLSLDRSAGFSTYAIGLSDLEHIVVPSGVQENLYVITSGPIPPNPAELIMEQRSRELFELLKEHFDYIIIDSAPIGLVTDAQLLKEHADATLYLVRQGVTFKDQIRMADEFYRGNKFPKMSLVVNDIDMKKGKGYGYYGYGYGYGYYGDESYFEAPAGGNKKKWWSVLSKK